jgi:hypothetical protein
MNINEKRSPEIVLKYFALLKWKNDEFKGRTAEEIIDNSEQELQSIEQELDTIQDSITEKNRFFLLAQKEFDDIKSTICSIEEDIVAVREKKFTARKKRNEHRQRSPKDRNSVLYSISEDTNISTFDSNSILLRLIIDIREDVKLICLDIWHAIITPKPLILFQYALIFLVAVILILESAYWVNVIFYVLMTSYISWKFFSIFRRSQKTGTYTSTGQETSQQANFHQEQTFESYFYELEQRNEAQEQYLTQKRLREKELTVQIQETNRNLTRLKHRRSKLIDFCQNKCREMENQKSQLGELLYLDGLTEKWLEEDIEKLTSKVKKKVDLIEKEHIGESGSLRLDPIRAVNGCTSKSDSPKLLVEDENDKDSRRNKILDQYSGDAKREYDYSGKERRYGIYEVQEIFICSNFLSSYKCYYNFIRDQSIDEEYCEYLYDSIVFTKIQEQSSINMQGTSKNPINSRCLTISTNDGKLISLQIRRSGIEKKLSSNPSKIDTAATEIRAMLRQRELPKQL